MTQPDLFSTTAEARAHSEAVTDEVAAKNRALHPEWHDKAMAEIGYKAGLGIEFTADDIAASATAPSPGSLGALFRAARKAGLIVSVGHREAKHKAANGRVLKVWKGVSNNV